MADDKTIPSKGILRSKTVWLQILVVLMALIPAVQKWIAANPVEFASALGAAGVLVRFVTSGRVSLFSDDASGGGSVTGGNERGAAGGDEIGTDFRFSPSRPAFPWLVVAASAVVMFLPACTVGVDAEGGWSIRPDPRTVDAGLRYLIRHDDDAAKSGLTQWKYYDPATGEEIPEEDYAAWGIKP